MAMRLSGLMSGMDTDSIIQELVAARRTKVDNAKKAQTKVEWKQEAWKDLNSKLKTLQSKYLSTMRFASSYSKKTTKVSNSAAVSVITGENAVNGVQALSVNQLAKTAYMTGGKLEEAPEGKQWTALSKISDIVGEDFAGGSITLQTNGKSVDINITENTTISDFMTQIKNAGLNANFDAGQQRFFISAKESGEKNNFTLTASNAGGMEVLAKLGLQTDISNEPAAMDQYKKFANYYVPGDEAATIANMSSMIRDDVDTKVKAYLDQYKAAKAAIKSSNDKIAELEEKYKDSPLEEASTYKADLDAKNAELKELESKIYVTPNGPEKAELLAEKAELEKSIKELTTLHEDATALEGAKKSIATNEDKLTELAEHITVTETTGDDGEVTYEAEATVALTEDVEKSYYDKAKFAAEMVEKVNNGESIGSTATKIAGTDAVITLNGATFTSTNNSFEINGLTFTALSETKAGEEVTITTQDDTDGIYDMIKGFLKEYNSIIKEMDKLYNAESAKGFEPLTDEEKEALSESEAEKYEKKIKDALLRRDDNLSGVSSALKSVMSAGVEIGGETLYLSDFGINTMGYFEAADNEKNVYHIDGDADDEYSASKADKLKGLISSDPNKVIDFFAQLSKNLYTKMSDLSKSVDGYRSFGNFYDDKKMQTDYTDYKSKIAELEEKLADYEDKWYKKFSAMETAMAKMQSSTSAVTALLGGQ